MRIYCFVFSLYKEVARQTLGNDNQWGSEKRGIIVSGILRVAINGLSGTAESVESGVRSDWRVLLCAFLVSMFLGSCFLQLTSIVDLRIRLYLRIAKEWYSFGKPLSFSIIVRLKS